jgi:DNA-binding FadR family transcriptional regulator
MERFALSRHPDNAPRRGQNATQSDASSPLDAARERYGASELVSRLRNAIAQEEFSHGDRLPAERELASQFGTSRGTARHALRELERLGLVTRRVGSGTFVNTPGLESADDVAEVTSPLELVEVRFAIEPCMVRQAIVNASPRDLARMRGRLERVEEAYDPVSFTEADKAFHLALAECSQNPLIVWLYQQINDVRSHSQWSAIKEQILSTSRIQQYNSQHRDLYGAISMRDTSKALDTMSSHLALAKDDLLGVED